jgi:hypothetical protein
MRTLAALCTACLLVGCGAEKTPRIQPQATNSVSVQKGATDPTIQMLLAASAKDFHAHQPPFPDRFRDVRAGYIIAPDGKKQHLVCGQFMPKKGQIEPEWTSFVTIQTSGYEQLIGSQAVGFCKQPSITWDEGEDLSALLQSQLDSLRSR